MKWKDANIRRYILHYLYGMLFVLLYCIGKSVCENHNVSGIVSNLPVFLLTLVIGGAAAGAGLLLFYRGLFLISGFGQWKLLNRIFTWRYVYICMWMLLTLVYLVCFIAYYPGTFAYDMPAQTWQAYGYDRFNTYQPVLHTLLWSFFVRVGEHLGKQALALALYSIFELVCVTMLSVIVVYEVRRITDNNCAALLSFLYYLLVPILHIMSFSTTKDIFFACFITLFIISIYEAMKQDSRRNWFGIVVFGLLACLFRNNMIYVVCIAFIISLFFRFPAKMKGFLLLVIALYGGITKVVFPTAGVLEGPKSEALPVPISQLSGIYVMHPEILSVEEKETILAYMPNAEAFNPRIADYVKSSFNDELLKSDSKRFWKTYLSVFQKAPMEYLNIFLDLNVDYWYLDAPVPDAYSQRGYIETETGEILDFYSVQSENYLPAVRTYYDEVAAHTHWSMHLPLIRYFYKLAFPLISLLVCLYLAIRNRNRLCVLPLALLIALFLTYLLGPVSIFRYLYPYYLALPLYFSMTAKSCHES